MLCVCVCFTCFGKLPLFFLPFFFTCFFFLFFFFFFFSLFILYFPAARLTASSKGNYVDYVDYVDVDGEKVPCSMCTHILKTL